MARSHRALALALNLQFDSRDSNVKWFYSHRAFALALALATMLMLQSEWVLYPLLQSEWVLYLFLSIAVNADANANALCERALSQLLCCWCSLER